MESAPCAPPPDWDRTTLAEHLERIRNNHFVGWVKLREWFQRLADLDMAYRTLVRNIDNPQSWGAAQFIPRAHTNLLAAATLALGGFANEVYPLLRSQLEQALYAHYVRRHPEAFDTWVRRCDSERSRRAMKGTFTVKAVMEDLKTADPSLQALTQTLYDRAIDYGAHPNPDSLLSQQSVKWHQGETKVTISTGYLVPGTTANVLALKSTAQSAVCSLRVFGRVFPERFSLLGLEARLVELARGL